MQYFRSVGIRTIAPEENCPHRLGLGLVWGWGQFSQDNCPRRKLPPNTNPNSYPNPNPNLYQGAIFLGGNCPNTFQIIEAAVGRLLFEIGLLKKFAKFQKKTRVLESLFINVAGFQPYQKETPTQVFSCRTTPVAAFEIKEVLNFQRFLLRIAN